MQCPKCNSKDIRVLDSRPEPKLVRRRRSCNFCNHRFSTIERLAEVPKQRKPAVKPKPTTLKPPKKKKYNEWRDVDHMTDEELEAMIMSGEYD